MKNEIFLTTLFIVILFNGFIVLVEPDTPSVLNYDLVSIVITIVPIVLALSLNFLGTGLNDTGLSIVFSIVIMFNVLYRVDIYGVNVGLGLITTLTEHFSRTEEIGIGWMIVNTLGFITFVSGMLALSGGD